MTEIELYEAVIETTDEIEISSLGNFHVEESTTVAITQEDEADRLDPSEERQLEEELRGRKIRCTCDSDPIWCELHNLW